MTAQTPAPKASGVSALLASLASVPPPPQPSVKEDFLAVILQALTAQPGGADHSSPAPTPKEKPSAPEAPAPDLTVASLLLALLVPPLPILSKSPVHKTSVSSDPAIPSLPQAAPAPAQSAPDSKAAKTDAAQKAPPLPAQATPTTEAESKPKAGTALPLSLQAAPAKEPECKPPPGGTSVAITSQRMNLSSESNEIAGRIEQKLPPQAISALSSADSGGPSPDGGTKTPLSFAWHEAPSEALAIIDLSAKAAGPAAPAAETLVEAPVRAVSAAPLERLEQMISREALTIRQSGAESLGVALKLDSNTQLFLQLTTNNGLVQASVRLDRGQFAPEDSQWAQLQQSLARQNVELLPMTGGSNLSFQQPSGERPRQQAARQDWSEAASVVPPAQQRQQKGRNRPRKNWESWA